MNRTSLAALALCAVGCGAPPNEADQGTVAQAASTSPYPPSAVFQGIDWDFNITRLAGGPGLDGSDLWAMSWAANGDLYGVWGDGKGVGETAASPSSDKAFMGLSRFIGPPPPTQFGTNPTATNIWGGIGTTNPNRYTDGTIAYGKGNTLLSVRDDLGNDVFVMQMAVQNAQRAFIGQQVVYSLDEGKTWTRIPNTGSYPFCGGLLFGPGTTGVPAALDGYTYGYLDQRNATGTLLCREPKSHFSKANIAGLASHAGEVQWFTGLDNHGNPSWGALASAIGVIKDVRTESTIVTYDPAVSRYIAFYEFNRPTSGDDTPMGPMAVLDAPNPWGPWTTVAYYQSWGGATLSPAVYNLGTTMLPNWLGHVSNGTQSFCVVFSGVGAYDAFNLLCDNALVLKGQSPPPVGLVADWKLNDGSGTIAKDASGNGNTGTLVNGPRWVAGRSGQPALAFDGVTNQYVDFGDAADLHLTGSMTLSAWFKANAFSATADMPVVSKRGYGPNRGWQLYTDGNGVAFDVAIDGNSYVVQYATTALDIGTWYHAVGVFDAPARTLNIYVNGVLANSGVVSKPAGLAVPGAQFDSALHVNVGRSAGGNAGQLFDGEIGEVRLYDTALTAAQVQALP